MKRTIDETMHGIIRSISIALTVAFMSLTAAAEEKFTVVIDAGHGGGDTGAVGIITREKDINLAVATKLGKLIEDNFKDVKVVYTRRNDTFVTLQGRADIANKAGGDLFISIHTNSIDKKARNYRTVAGASVYTLGFRRTEENLAVAMRENSVMKLEADYSTVYEGFDPSSTESYIIFEMSRNKHVEQSVAAAQAIQQELVATAGRRDRGVRQANFWVLFKTSMPAVLVELDFICNPVQEKYMASNKGREKMAQAIFNGFREYKRSIDLHTATVNGGKVASKGKNMPKPQRKLTPVDEPVHQVTPSADSAGKKVSEADNTATVSEKASDRVSSGKQVSEEAKSVDRAKSASADDNRIIYKVQFMTSSKRLGKKSSEYKGMTDVECYVDGRVYKYTVGSYTSLSDAQKRLRQVRKQFPDAFVIKTRNGKRIK
ncbi:N-acetylmuramoyl-L-alanine amidase [Paramuribaculum intestinale]|nr:N-acetylmuramoyl-L-alanine amidase [Paramuribaculum intestinale]MCX4329200.1 N-acetylmuramoyl-L-alanine amidase [Paramuribaculum intestinale]WLT42185.1 N-acetylmuramoyl-L-alanine amidase [Paramuribaculum intestinale]